MMIYTFFAMAVLKSSSVLYVGSMQMLDLTREQASWPATLSIMLSQLAGKFNSDSKKSSLCNPHLYLARADAGGTAETSVRFSR